MQLSVNHIPGGTYLEKGYGNVRFAAPFSCFLSRSKHKIHFLAHTSSTTYPHFDQKSQISQFSVRNA